MISVYLEDILLKDTPDLKDVEEVIEMDTELKAWVHKFGDLKLTFFGDGYNYIKAKKKIHGYNYRMSGKLVESPDSGSVGDGDVVNFFIYFTDLTFEHTKLSVTAPLIEVFFEGTIKQNQKSDIYFDDLQKTLNGLVLDDVPVEEDVEVFKPLDGTALFTVHGIELSSAIASAIGYITDNAVTFQDNYFPQFGKDKFLLVNGNQFRTQDTSTTRIKTFESFQNLMEQVYKLFNVWWYIDYTTLKPTFVIDHFDVIMASTGGITMDYVRNIEESFNEDAFFTSIKIGSETFEKSPVVTYTEYLQFINGYTHHKESYSAKNNTMIDKEFDLVTNWIIDHNVINTVLTVSTANPQYDDKNFLIQYDSVTAKARQFEFANISTDIRRLYNEDLTNVKRLERFTLPIELGFDFSITSNNFEARLSADVNHTGVASIATTTLPCNIEVTDPNNNYNNATYEYTCPATIEGLYGFEQNLRLIFAGIPAPTVTVPNPCVEVTLYLFNLNPPASIKQFFTKKFLVFSNTGSEGQEFIETVNFYLNATNYVVAQYSMMSGQRTSALTFFASPNFLFDVTLKAPETTFRTLYVQNQGGTIVTDTNIRDYHGGIINYTNNVPLNTWKELKKNSIQSITCTTGDGRMAETKIKSLKRNKLTGKTTFELITKESKVGL